MNITMIKDQSLPVGAVTYQLDKSSGNLNARWAFSAQSGVEIVCRGLATPLSQTPKTTAPSFVGTYQIIYYGPDSTAADPWDLEIKQKGELFDLTWSKEGTVTYHGIGFLAGNLLVCGWRPTL